MSCCHCGKEIEIHLNYCNWNCQIEAAKAAGGKVIAPNNLPIKCIKADGTMLECEDGDHPTYKFPVYVCDSQGDVAELHALIYNDDSIALTLWECRYYLWSLHDGYRLRSGKTGPRLTNESLEKIKCT